MKIDNSLIALSLPQGGIYARGESHATPPWVHASNIYLIHNANNAYRKMVFGFIQPRYLLTTNNLYTMTEADTLALSKTLHEEHQYLNLIRHILDSGEHRPDR